MKIKEIFKTVNCLFCDNGKVYLVHVLNGQPILEELRPSVENKYLEFYMLDYDGDVPNEPMVFMLLLQKKSDRDKSYIIHHYMFKNDGWKALAVKDNLVLFPQVSMWGEVELITDRAIVIRANGEMIDHTMLLGNIYEARIESKGDYLEIRTNSGTCYFMARNGHRFEQIGTEERPQTLPYGWATPVSIGLSLEDIEELLR